MAEVTREQLHAYLDDCLPEAEAARIEKTLRSSEPLRKQLQATLQERDRGEHSVGAIWRRERLSCISREQLGSFLLQALDDNLMDYVRFHLETILCPFCLANLADLKAQQGEPTPQAKKRHRKIYESSAGLLSAKRK